MSVPAVADTKGDDHSCAFDFEVLMTPSKAASLAIFLILLSSLICWSQTVPQLGNSLEAQPFAVGPVDRLVAKIDDNQRVALAGSRHPLAKIQNAIGAAPRDQSMPHMVLVLLS